MGIWTALLLAAGILLLADLVLHLVAVRLVLPQFERKIPFGVEPAQPNPSAETVSFPTTNGLTLRGSYYKHTSQPSRGLILFCPELGGNHWSALSYAGGLFEAGYDILSFDFRNQGESDALPGYDPLHWLTEYEVQDVQAAMDFIQSRPDLAQQPLGLFGISRGGGAALAVATRRPDVRAIACEGAYSTESLLLHYALRWASLYLPAWLMRRLPLWHVRLTLAIARKVSERRRGCRLTLIERKLHRLAGRPVLMIAGGRDTYVSPQITGILASKVGAAHDPLWIVPKAKHNQAREIDKAGYDARLLEVFQGLKGGAEPTPTFPRLMSVA